MAQEIDLQVRFTAEDMYVRDRMTYEKIAADLGVALNTVKRWSKLGNWRAKRDEHLKNHRNLTQKLTDLGVAMMDSALESRDPQKAYAALRVLKMEREIAAEIRRKAIEDAAATVEETARQQGLDEDQAQFWREKVLGIK